MAEKQSVILYHDWFSVFESLPGDEVKELILAIIKYSQNGTEPEFNSSNLNIAWKFIEIALRKDNEKYIEKCVRNAENGKKGGRPKKQTLSEKTEKTEWVFEKPKKADNNNDNNNNNDNDNDNESVNENDYECKNEEKSAHAHGKYSNVFLTEKEYRSFAEAYPLTYKEIIDELSIKIGLYPAKYARGHAMWLETFAKHYKPPEQKKPEEKYSPPSFDVDLALKRSRELDPTQTKRQSLF